jgi:cellulose synthase/poly-beta-1,6-N-acetylglucosamine synthase-like glycosyltransferase
MSKHDRWMTGFSFAVLPLMLRAEVMLRRMPELRPSYELHPLPPLSIIIPARNEEANLQRLLPSLAAQIYPGELEIIVVDDHSTDQTACVAARCGARLLCAPALLPGWGGKTNAAEYGASQAHGAYFLFTDADTCHEPLSAATAVAYAETKELDGLSIFLRQKSSGSLDKTVLMVAFAGLFAGMERSTPLLNGQYLLLRRETYAASGGFAAVKGEMLEDLAYGRVLAESGFNVPLMRGEELAEVHMYRSLRDMWHGITRIGSGSLRNAGPTALIPALLITGLMMPIWALFFGRADARNNPRLWLLWAGALGSFIPWGRRFGSPWQALFAPLAALFVQAASFYGLVARLLGHGLFWKGRKV